MEGAVFKGQCRGRGGAGEGLAFAFVDGYFKFRLLSTDHCSPFANPSLIEKQ